MKIWELYPCQPILEEGGIKQIFGRSKGGKTVGRKFRCTSGPRKGRVVGDPSTCMKPINVAQRIRAKQSRPKFKSRASLARKRTLRTNPVTKSIMKRNIGRKPKKHGIIKGLKFKKR